MYMNLFQRGCPIRPIPNSLLNALSYIYIHYYAYYYAYIHNMHTCVHMYMQDAVPFLQARQKLLTQQRILHYSLVE